MKNTKNLMLKDLNETNINLHEQFKELSNLKNEYEVINSNYKTMKKHLLDLEKFIYDKNCKYCVKNGTEQINEART